MKAQITIFILIGLVILISFGAMLYFGTKESPKAIEIETEDQKQWQETLHSAQTWFQHCFEEGVATGMELITHQGGVIYESQGGKTPDATPKDSILYDEHNVRYNIIPPEGKVGNLYYADIPQYPWIEFPYLSLQKEERKEHEEPTKYWWYGYYGRTNLPPLYNNYTQSIQENIATYLSNYLEHTCAKDYASTTKNTKFNWQPAKVNMTIASDTAFVLAWEKENLENIIFTAELGAELASEKFRARIAPVSTSLRIRLSKIYYFTSEVIQKDTTDINFSLRGFFPNQMRVSVIPQGTDDIIKITDTLSTLNNQPLDFTFARQNRAPALYQLCTPPQETALCPGSIILLKNLSTNLPACKPIFPPCAEARNETGLTLRMTFDKPSVNRAQDISGNNHHGTPYGPTPIPGTCAGALAFAGDDYIDLGNPPALRPSTALSTEAWIKFYDVTTNQDIYTPQGFITIISKWGNTGTGTAGFGLFLGGGSKPMFIVSTTGVNRIIAQGPSPLKTNVWYHLAGVYDGITNTIYVNGQAVGTAQGRGPIVSTPARIMIGAYDFQPPTSFFTGAIDEVRMYNRALTPKEVMSHYKQDQNNKQAWEVIQNKTTPDKPQPTPYIIIDNPIYCGADTAIPLASIDPDEDTTTYSTTPVLPHNITSKEASANTATGYSLKIYTHDNGELFDHQTITLPITYTTPEKPTREQTNQTTTVLCDKLSKQYPESDGAASTTILKLCRWVCPNNKIYDCTEKCDGSGQFACKHEPEYGTVALSQRLIEMFDDCAADTSPAHTCIALRTAIIGMLNTTVHPYTADNPGTPFAVH